MPRPMSGPCSMVTTATKMAEPRTTTLSPPSSSSSTLRTPSPALVMTAPSQGVVMLLMPHVILALVILMLLFTDFVLYRRRVHFQQKRAFDKQELMETFPKRVIGGVYRNIPNSVNASPLHVPSSPNHLTVPQEPNAAGNTHKTPIKTDKTFCVKTDKTSPKTDKTSTTTTTTTESPNSESTGSGSTQEAAAQKKQARKKQVKLQESSRSSTTLSTDSVESAAAVDRGVGGGSAVSCRRLEKRETCRKLPPIKQDSRLTNGFAQKEDKKLSPLVDVGEREDLSMA